MFVDNSLLVVVIVVSVIAIVAIIAGVIFMILYIKLRAAYKRSYRVNFQSINQSINLFVENRFLCRNIMTFCGLVTFSSFHLLIKQTFELPVGFETVCTC